LICKQLPGVPYLFQRPGNKNYYGRINPNGKTSLMMAGGPGEGAFVDARGIGGLTADVNRTLSRRVCELLNESLGVAPRRVYLNFTEVKAANWGWNGISFG
jgi:phenylpyruvate tautomerase PptA (4-oxalocrotonate tautomerase family)